MIRRIVIAATIVLALWAAPAAAQYDPLIVSPGRVQAGGVVAVSGQGCAPGATVTVSLQPGAGPAQLDATSAPGTAIGSVVADGTGAFTTSVVIPADTAPGTYTVYATCTDPAGGRLLVRGATVEVLAPGVAPAGRGAAGASQAGAPRRSALPRTGSSADLMAAAGAVLLASGGLLLLAARKRRTARLA